MILRAFGAASAAALVFAAASGAAAQSSDARHFLTKAMEGDNSEMMLGSLAAQRGASPDLRAYGQTLHDDHSQAFGQASQLAHQLGVPETHAVMPEASKERAKLEHLKGAAFDREFAHYMVKDHHKDISDFQKEAGKGGPTGQLAQKTLPVLHKHLEMAERLSKG